MLVVPRVPWKRAPLIYTLVYLALYLRTYREFVQSASSHGIMLS